MAPKITKAYENNEYPERCPVKMYEKYMSLRPKNGKVDAFYLRPRNNYSTEVWYCDAPVGIHLLQKTVQKLCESAGLKGHFSNHSLRATAATRLYAAGVDEQLIAEKTGHKSNAIRSYKRTNDNQQAEMSKILRVHNASPPPPCKKLKTGANAKDDEQMKVKNN